MAFATLCLARLFHGFNLRGEKSIFKLGLFTNKYSIGAFLLGSAFLASALLIPPLQHLFEVTPLSMKNFLEVVLYAFIPTVIIQIYKVIKK
jgi:Ca2+-transporting ATPase